MPHVVEMQSEGGAAGAVHGALQTGALTTTFTASQGLLLMIPNMFKIAGELTPTVFHVAARAAGGAGALDLRRSLRRDGRADDRLGDALLELGPGSARPGAHRAERHARVAHPVRALLRRLPHLARGQQDRGARRRRRARDDRRRAGVRAPRAARSIPTGRSCAASAQNPDVYFQARETVNPFYAACPRIVQAAMDRFAALTGRQYQLFDYFGAPDAERVIVLMGSGAETARETIEYLNAPRREASGVVQVHLFRPFSVDASARRPSRRPSRAIAVLDRTKEPGAPASRCTRTW